MQGALAACAVAATVAAPAQAAPTLAADRACYLPGQPIALAGAGFTPGASLGVVLALSGERGSNVLSLRDPLMADATGTMRLTITAPDLASDSDARERTDVTATDLTKVPPAVPTVDPANPPLGTTAFQLTGFDARVAPWERGEGDPRRTVTMRIRGFAGYRTVYAHYFLRGRRVRTVRVGGLQGACGDITRHMREFPFRPVRAGSWTVRFSPARVFDPDGYWVGYRDVVVPRRKAVA